MDGTVIVWRFADGRSLKRRLPMDEAQALTFARSDSVQRGIFRRAGLAIRSRSEFEYLDAFPRVTSVESIQG